MKKIIDITGQQFGKLTALYPIPPIAHPYKWRCKCECGNEKDIRSGHLRSGHTTSCGCTWYKCGELHKSWKGYKEISSKFFKSIKSNAKIRKLPFDIAIEKVWELFLSQNRQCALSGLPIVFEANHSRIKGTASLDRIDSSKGYVEGNIQWLHSMVNQMKWNIPQAKFLKMCHIISQRQLK